jgi:hypothetical protein
MDFESSSIAGTSFRGEPTGEARFPELTYALFLAIL